MLDDRADAFDEIDADAHAVDRRHDVREQHCRVDIVARDRLQRDLRAELGRAGEIEERMPLTERAVLR